MLPQETYCSKEDCKYRGKNSYVVTCDYMLQTGHRRGCPIGDECTQYESGVKVHSWSNYWQYVTKPGTK